MQQICCYGRLLGRFFAGFQDAVIICLLSLVPGFDPVLFAEVVLDSFVGSRASNRLPPIAAILAGCVLAEALVLRPMMVWSSTSVDAETMQNAGCWQHHDSLLKGNIELLKPSRLQILAATNWNYPVVDSTFICC
ncbi:hypothetical protein Nepgr_015845 [Nepenthes gracilis]|uniref:Uncharacterized protein n=1 Tax=Nepenthes gracilis TaxID=150966 RepID=A0AAD3SNP1_NEPGR|nr:hypothetical protein Nepgr_015845 [Nepenthes gracilis]